MHLWRIPARAPTATIAQKAGGLTRNTGAAANLRQRLLFSRQGRRAFVCSPAVMAATPAVMAATPANGQAPRFSPGVDEPALTRALEPLLASAELGGRWALVPGGEGLERSFKFKTFAKTWDFMTAVSLQCKLKNHHPEWSNVYNTTYIRWTTHNPKGLSAKDVELADICDNLAKDFGEIVEDAGSGDSRALKQVADRAVTNAGDCCTPKK
ncbi:transcriptional coactivator/pterin dehydratase [Hypoxylon cercidicola]|nr:transcriptional coactivator/pterin dehydratase [Hypoxylon cercidicola]